jgi:maltose-binding protein MalE
MGGSPTMAPTDEFFKEHLKNISSSSSSDSEEEALENAINEIETKMRKKKSQLDS